LGICKEKQQNGFFSREEIKAMAEGRDFSCGPVLEVFRYIHTMSNHILT
jgi:hypothetical protein